MELPDAIGLIQQAIPSQSRVWADLGAGTGLFTQALLDILPEEARVHALDKSPRYLYDLWRSHRSRLVVHEGDFSQKMDLPQLDGILMANALHYVKDKRKVVQHILSYLREGGHFILIEYDTDRPNPPWVPYPISWSSWQESCGEMGLEQLRKIGDVPSSYGYQRIYSAVARKADASI